MGFIKGDMECFVVGGAQRFYECLVQNNLITDHLVQIKSITTIEFCSSISHFEVFRTTTSEK